MYDEYEESTFSQVGRSGRWHDARTPLTGSAQGVFWFIHVEDAASGTVAAVSTGESSHAAPVDRRAPVKENFPPSIKVRNSGSNAEIWKDFLSSLVPGVSQTG